MHVPYCAICCGPTAYGHSHARHAFVHASRPPHAHLKGRLSPRDVTAPRACITGMPLALPANLQMSMQPTSAERSLHSVATSRHVSTIACPWAFPPTQPCSYRQDGAADVQRTHPSCRPSSVRTATAPASTSLHGMRISSTRGLSAPCSALRCSCGTVAQWGGQWGGTAWPHRAAAHIWM